MTSEPGERPTGPPHPEPGPPRPERSDDALEAVPADARPLHLPPYSSGSGDDELNASLTEVQPDPYLGGLPAVDARSGPVADVGGPPSSESFDAVSALIGFTDPHPVEPVVGRADGVESPAFAATGPESLPTPPASSDQFPAIDLTAPPSSTRGTPADVPDQDEDDDLPASRTSWATLLLFSYASAVTLGLLWVLLSGRRVGERDAVEPVPAVDTRPDPGLRADDSRKVTPPPPLAADRLTTLGKAIRTGSLEVTPLEVRSDEVTLLRTVAGRERRDGGRGALKLKVRLKNVSADTVFAPLDEAFLREREPGTLDSYIETERGGRLGMYPLAVASEWAIAGQVFREIGPGQSLVTVVVSESDVADSLTAEMTWRVRLRTGINQTDTIGVRFRKDEVKPAD